MNKLGVHAFVWEKGWSREEATRAIARTKEVGYDLIEVSALEPRSIDVSLHPPRAREGRARGDLFARARCRERHLVERPRQGEERAGEARGCGRDGARHRRDPRRRHPVLGLPEIRDPDHGGGRQALGRGAAAGRRDGREEQRHPRPRSREPLRDQRAQHGLAGRRDVPTDQARRTSRCTSTSIT